MQSKHTQQQWRQRDVEGSWILCKSVWTQFEQGFRLQRQKCDSLNLNCLFFKAIFDLNNSKEMRYWYQIITDKASTCC